MGLRDINPYAFHIPPAVSEALIKMLDKREMYVEQARFKEAHGAGTMILLLWQTLSGFSDTIPTLPSNLAEE